MIQWITHHIRYKEDKSSILDQLFTKAINLELNKFGSDHVILKIEIKRYMEDKQEELFKKKRSNYAKSNYTAS